MTGVRWKTFVPTKWRPKCPACGRACRPGVGSGTAREGPEGGTKKTPDYKYFCAACEQHVLAKNPCLLARTDPEGPRHTEDPDVRFAPAGHRTKRAGARQQPMAATAKGPPPKIAAAAGTYRKGVEEKPHVMDTTIGFQNAYSIAAPGQAQAYYRDVALTLNDIHGLSESNLEPEQAAVLEAHLRAQGHRMWATHRTSRDSQKGTGTVIVARSTVAPKPGDGLVYTKDDGKAMAVALTIVDQPLYYLVMHLPHTDADQKRFLEEVQDGMAAAMALHVSKTEGGRNVGARWTGAPVLRAGDMNMTEHPLDNERGAHTPGPGVVEAMRGLDAALGCGADVYRTMEPNGVGFTHGKEGQGRRLDTFGAPPEWLQGPTGVVAHRELSPRATAYSYVDTSSRKEVYKESDHALIQITLRVSKIVKPPPKPTITLGALRSPAVKKTVDAILERGDELQQPTGGESYLSEQHFAAMHEEVLKACIAQQKHERSRRNRLRQRLVTKLERLDKQKQQRWATTQERPSTLDAYLKTERHVSKLTTSLQKQQHKIRRHRDALASYKAQMQEAGMGKAPKPVTRPEPVTQLNVRKDGTPDGASPLTEQKDMLEGATNYYRRQLNAPFTPTPTALRDRAQVLAGLGAAMRGKLPRSVARGLDIEAIIHTENIVAAIKSLHRESTPGVDMMPLDFYIENLQRIAPQLSALYRELLQ